jgi:hypothetical protein
MNQNIKDTRRLQHRYGHNVTQSTRVARRYEPVQLTGYSYAGDFELKHQIEQMVNVEQAESDYGRMMDDLEEFQLMRQFFRENPEQWHNFDMWKTMDLLRR